MILITGSAGFIGFNLAELLLTNNFKVIGIDNLNNYYDKSLKLSRLKILKRNDNFTFHKIDLLKIKSLESVLKKYKPTTVVHLAAQAGVRYSFENPDSYIDSNLIVFYNLLQCIQKFKIKKFLYASSSSVYGSLDKKNKYLETDNTDSPRSLYAATKKSNELLAYYYANTFKIKMYGLRFFTVYGPFGRPDMSLFIFVKNIINNKPIDVFNFGKHKRDFTYVDDITNYIYALIKVDNSNFNYHEIFNLGNGSPRKLMDYIKIIEKNLSKKAKINFKPMQRGDVYETKADITKIKKITNFSPKTDIEKGIKNFIEWYKSYYNVK